MNYKTYILRLFFRILLLVGAILSLTYTINQNYTAYTVIICVSLVYLLINTYIFVKRRFVAMDDFFEAVKYRDFSRWFPEDKGPKDIRFLYTGFNEINRTIKEINSKNQAQYVYLQKILEMVDIGIIAYNLESGDVLWSNDSFGEILDIPSFKNIKFVEKRKPELFNTIFDTYHREPNSISIALQNENIKILISDTVFQVEEDAFKLIVIQDIDNTLNKNESESWKKLLSVMTHEIMNSIAPISSLADTLQKSLQIAIEKPEDSHLELDDLNSGIKTIKNRSEGLLKFAKTYRSLSKVTKLKLQNVKIPELFSNIQLLMAPSIEAKNIDIEFKISSPKLELDIDTHLIEQVLINLLLNAVDACKNHDNPEIKVLATQNSNRNIVIKVYDNGSGIPQDILENIFVPFFTSKTTGSGIGLSLCKQIMLLHKGRIIVKSIEGEGSVFSLIF
ncbi:HAMP domain-containing histidine kinase [Flavobacteriaceae bacterium S0825]|uniref:sensor histidine kinase n=1 Tax=Gaetbulibacter sp. S0825 TaxID=2720084 RepID=UPI0014301A1C|nr:HAMP domain-containing sensor histidine kinase [Gaetbulibacter sp. S0825]MCK0109996.1 HAMP domain-containing histidine kinase [Flavobacteriaceae bacterium S0825]NIX65625.1 HAMP domain-containing histidine kinase [Gaetbulibacter sp. S0825]